MRPAAVHPGAGPAAPRAAPGGRPTAASGQRSLAGSLALIGTYYRAPVLAALGFAAAGTVLGVLLREVLAKYADLGAFVLVGAVTVGVAAAGVALAAPVLSLLACAAVAFSASAAVLHGDYGLPILTKYLPLMLLFALAVRGVRRTRSALLPAFLRLDPAPEGLASGAYVLCLSLLAAHFALALVPVLYATDPALALDELTLQRRNLVLALSLALSVGAFGRWSSLPVVCTVALYATSATILLAIIGSFYPSLERLLPGFASVYTGTGTVEADATAARIAGAFGHPNTLGRYAVFTMPLAIWSIGRGGIAGRAAAALCLVVLLAGVLLSESRGALLVLGIVALPGLVVAARTLRPGHWLAALIVGGSVVGYAWQHVDSDRMARSVEDVVGFVEDGAAPSDGATRGRLAEMRVAYELWATHPLRGVGLGNFEHYFQIYSYDLGTKLYNDDRAAHSLYLELLSERGLFGLAGFVLVSGAIVLAVLHRGIDALRRGAGERGRLMIALTVSALAYYLSAVLLHDVHSAPIWALIGVMIASVRPSAGHGAGHALVTRTRRQFA